MREGDDVVASFQALKSRAVKAREEVAAAKAQYDFVMKNLYDNFGVKTLDAAEQLLEQKEAERSKLRKEVESNVELLSRALDEFEGDQNSI